jgi:hypothetical protein
MWFLTLLPDSKKTPLRYLLSFSNNLMKLRPTSVLSPGSYGKLAYKEEPGKVRVFAMVDTLTQ